MATAKDLRDIADKYHKQSADEVRKTEQYQNIITRMQQQAEKGYYSARISFLKNDYPSSAIRSTLEQDGFTITDKSDIQLGLYQWEISW